MDNWQASVGFTTAEPFDENSAFDLMDSLSNCGASVAMDRNHSGGEMTVALTASSAMAAASEAIRLLKESPHVSNPIVCSIEVLLWQDAVAKVRESLYPKVVGNAEIARMAGVTRQRAFMLRKLPDFPKPVIETAQGALYAEPAVSAWMENRNAKPGRRKSDQ